MLTTRQLEILRAAVNRMIPPDDFPGGWEGGVGDYLLAQFEGDLRFALSTYAAGLDSLDMEALAVYNLPYQQLPVDAQDDLLTRIETRRLTTPWLVDPLRFLDMLIQHCAEGYYSDPGSGGNRDGIAWKMIGFEVSDDSL